MTIHHDLDDDDDDDDGDGDGDDNENVDKDENCTSVLHFANAPQIADVSAFATNDYFY